MGGISGATKSRGRVKKEEESSKVNIKAPRHTSGGLTNSGSADDGYVLPKFVVG